MRRSIFELKIAVLKATTQPILHTHIVYEARLNGNITKQILKEYLNKQFVTTTTCPTKPKTRCKNFNSNRTYYVITLKGQEILKTAETLLKEMA